jgi:hypothetical protein
MDDDATAFASPPGGGRPEEPFDFTRLEAIAREYGIELVGPLPEA